VGSSLIEMRKASYLDIHAALRAICSTGRGRCWHCDRKLPPVEEATDTGWEVRCVEGERVASIILLCPKCACERDELGEEGSLYKPPPRLSNA
jgi:hypothetical protein